MTFDLRTERSARKFLNGGNRLRLKIFCSETSLPDSCFSWRHENQLSIQCEHTYPICDSPLQRSVRRSFAPLQKSRRHNSFYVCSKAQSNMVFVAPRKAIWYSRNPYTIFDSPLQRSVRCCSAPSQKSRSHKNFHTRREAQSGMIFVAAQKLSGKV